MQQEQLILFVKHLSGETTDKEENELKLLLDKDADALASFNELRISWENSLELKSDFDISKGLQLMQSKIKQKQNKIKKNILFRIAAIFVGLMLVSSILWMDYSRLTVVQADNTVKIITLPDSSIVYLKSGAQISYRNPSLLRYDREVVLQGEAFFDIKKSKNKKFVVNTNLLDIQVLGTQFNVVSNNDISEVVLEEGNVRLFNLPKEQDDIYMAPGDQIIYSIDNNNIEKLVVNPVLHSFWKESHISFKDFNLGEVGEIIEQLYGKEMIINDKSLLNRTLSGSAPLDDLNLLLKALSLILDKDIISENDTIVIN